MRSWFQRRVSLNTIFDEELVKVRGFDQEKSRSKKNKVFCLFSLIILYFKLFKI